MILKFAAVCPLRPLLLCSSFENEQLVTKYVYALKLADLKIKQL